MAGLENKASVTRWIFNKGLLNSFVQSFLVKLSFTNNFFKMAGNLWVPCLVLVLTPALVFATGHDATMEPGNSGHDVVEMTVDRILSSCIFPDDKGFLRRLAYVESSDGMHPGTYREDYHGGIWQVRPRATTSISLIFHTHGQ